MVGCFLKMGDPPGGGFWVLLQSQAKLPVSPDAQIKLQPPSPVALSKQTGPANWQVEPCLVQALMQ